MAAIMNYVSFRYVVFSHAMFLIAAYRPLVRVI